MAETVNRGPNVSVGSLIDGRIEPWDGPSINYQGDMFPDCRFSPVNKDTWIDKNVIKGFYNVQPIAVVDCIPSANSTVTVAAAQAPSTTVGVALALVTAVAGTAADVPVWSPGVPIVNALTGATVTVSAIDLGFATCTTVANSSAIVVVDNSKLGPGNWVCIPGAGSAAGTNVPLICLTTGRSGTTTVTVTPVPLASLSNVPVAQTNLYSNNFPVSTQFGNKPTLPTGVEPYKGAGFGLTFDAPSASCRALSVTAASIGSGTTAITVNGYDIYGFPMTELIAANGTNTVNGKKAFKYVSTVTVAAAATTVTPANISVGISDVFGLNLRSERWEFLQISWNGCLAQTSAGWTSALTTTSSTTTIDVRGTVNASTLAIASVASTNGGQRLTIIQQNTRHAIVAANPSNFTTLFGVAQV